MRLPCSILYQSSNPDCQLTCTLNEFQLTPALTALVIETFDPGTQPGTTIHLFVLFLRLNPLLFLLPYPPPTLSSFFLHATRLAPSFPSPILLYQPELVSLYSPHPSFHPSSPLSTKHECFLYPISYDSAPCYGSHRIRHQAHSSHRGRIAPLGGYNRGRDWNERNVGYSVCCGQRHEDRELSICRGSSWFWFDLLEGILRLMGEVLFRLTRKVWFLWRNLHRSTWLYPTSTGIGNSKVSTSAHGQLFLLPSPSEKIKSGC